MNWDTDWAPVRMMTWVGRVLLVGLMVLVAGLPLVTLPAALAGGVAAQYGIGGTVFSRFWEAFRPSLARGVPVALLMLVSTAVVGVDWAWATSQPLRPITTIVVAASSVLAWLAASVCLLSVPHLTSGRVRDILRDSGFAAARSPLRGIALLVAIVATVLVAMISLPFVVVALGLDCALLARLARSSTSIHVGAPCPAPAHRFPSVPSRSPIPSGTRSRS